MYVDKLKWTDTYLFFNLSTNIATKIIDSLLSNYESFTRTTILHRTYNNNL